MTKYNEGDVLEITEDFVLECASYSEGEKYTISEVDRTLYTLETDEYSYSNTISEVDAHSGFRKVEPKVEFKVGDKVRLLETGHGSPGYSCDTPEAVKERLASKGLDYQAVFEVTQEADIDGDLHVSHAEKYVGLYVLPEFLVPWVEEEPVRMELGKTYQSTSNDLFYTPTEIDFEAGRVSFDYKSSPSSLAYKSTRRFYNIEEEFGVLPPVKPVEVSQVTLDELKEQLKPENTLASAVASIGASWESSVSIPETETVSVDALREALDFLGIQEVFDTENIISLAQRLS